MKIKNILVPIDFSENSLNALKYVAAFADSREANIFLLHITDPDSLENELRGNLSPEHLMELISKEDYLKGFKLNPILMNGKVVDLTLSQSQKYSVDLIVMGTQGASNMQRNLFGTHTSGVISKTDCPLLAVPADAVFGGINKTVMAVDLEHRADHLIEETIELLKKQEASILLCYVGKDRDHSEEHTLLKLTDDIKNKTGYHNIICQVIHSTDFPESLENYALATGADLLVMFTHHRGVYESIFSPSKTKKFAYHTSLPLLVIPQHKKPVFFF